MENNSRQIPTEHMNTLPDPTSMKKARTCKGNDEGKAKRGKETTIEDLVAVRKEELKTYVDVKTKQIESYRDVKMALMEKRILTKILIALPIALSNLRPYQISQQVII